ncbi:MAG: NUDIX domain-containing protein [Patescibacteria group bacterium]|nr:NUDIX domain-containing protein [Patescibacteria group bacterium]
MKKKGRKPEFKKYKYSAAAVDLVVFAIIDGELNALLTKMKYKPFEGKLALPGGRIRVYESVDDCAKREIKEKIGIENIYMEQLYSFGDVKRDPSVRIISISYLALIGNVNNIKLKTTEKYEKIYWMPINKISKLAYDHSEILKYALSRLKSKLIYTNIVCNLLPQKFSLSEMQRVHEIILNRKLDKRNFRKKVFALDLIKEAGREEGVSHRPSKLYSFKTKKLMIIEMF